MQYDKLTKKELVRIIEGIRSPRYGRTGADQADTLRILEAVLLERYELEAKIEALKNSNLRLEESLSEFTSLFELAPAPYVVLDAGGFILRMNESALKVIRAQRTTSDGFSFSRFLTKNTRPLFLDHLTECRHFNNTVRSVDVDIVAAEAALPITMMGFMLTEYRGIFFPRVSQTPK